MSMRLNRREYATIIADDIERIMKDVNARFSSEHRHAVSVLHNSVRVEYDVIPAAVRLVSYFTAMGQIPDTMIRDSQQVLNYANEACISDVWQKNQIRLRGVVNHGWPTS